MFIAALFTIARTWKQPKCPSTDEWIQKMWHIYISTCKYYIIYIKYCLNIKRNEILIHATTWVNLLESFAVIEKWGERGTAGLREGFLSRGLTLACLKAKGKVPEVREELRSWRI